MDGFSKWLKEVMHLTAPGMLYLISLILFIILFTKTSIKIDDYSIFYKNPLLILFFGLFCSYIIGLSVDYASRYVIWKIRPKFYNEFKKSIKTNGESEFQVTQTRFIMFRHLVLSFFILGILILVNIEKDDLKVFWPLFIMIAICLIILVLAYLYMRKVYYILIKGKLFRIIKKYKFTIIHAYITC